MGPRHGGREWERRPGARGGLHGRPRNLGVAWPEGTKAEASDLEVHVPAGSRVWVTTASAEIEVEGVTGSLALTTAEGRIRVTGAPREVDAESIDGGIEIAADAMSVRA